MKKLTKTCAALAVAVTVGILPLACDDDDDLIGGVTGEDGNATGDGTTPSPSPGGGPTVEGGTTADGGSGGGNGGVPTPGTNETSATFTPAEVASIVLVVNLGEVQQGQLAMQKSNNPEVRGYAQRMVTEHSAAVLRLRAIPGVGASASPNDTTAQILMRHDQLIAEDLQRLDGTAFDVAYMTTQIEAHAKVVAMAERSLLPSLLTIGNTGTIPGVGTSTDTTGAPELSRELANLRPVIAQHLVQALVIQRALRTGGAGGADGGAGGADGGIDAGAGGDADAGGDAGAGGDADAGGDAGAIR